MEWIEGKKYPKESGKYTARFKSGKIRVAYFTLITQKRENRETCGKWGNVKPGYANYIPLQDPLEWLSQL